jgi:hypothetical protein
MNHVDTPSLALGSATNKCPKALCPLSLFLSLLTNVSCTKPTKSLTKGRHVDLLCGTHVVTRTQPLSMAIIIISSSRSSISIRSRIMAVRSTAHVTTGQSRGDSLHANQPSLRCTRRDNASEAKGYASNVPAIQYERTHSQFDKLSRTYQSGVMASPGLTHFISLLD